MSKNDEKTVVAPTKEKTVAEQIQEAVSAALAIAIPQAVAAAVQIATAQSAQAPVYAAGPAPVDTSRCPECKQYTRGCKGKHSKMVVFPKNDENGEWFPGLSINGVLYRSSHSNHHITVPEQNDLASGIYLWEQSERTLRHGRKASHNSGSIGPRGSHTNKATAANWG